MISRLLRAGQYNWASFRAIGLDQDHTKIVFQDHARAADVRRVLIVENQTLLGAGIHSLLWDEAGLETYGISPHDQAELIQEIERLQPDIVIMNKASHLMIPLNLLAALENHSRIQLVVVSADGNQVCIYDKRQVLVRQAADFLDVVRQR